MKLFRQQAIEHQHRLHGEVFLVSPLPWRAIIALLAALVLIAAAILAFGTSSRSVTASGSLRLEKGRWLAVLSMSDGPASRIRIGQAAQLDLIADPAPGAGRLSGTVHRIGAPGGEQVDVAILLDPLTPEQRARGLILRAGLPIGARILTGRETLLQALSRPATDEER